MGTYLLPDGGLAATDPKSVLGASADPQLDPGLINFVMMWGKMLDRELSSADRVGLYTPERRKQAINDAHLEFCRRTRCLDGQFGIPIVSGTPEYVLEAEILGFLGLTPQAISVQIETAGQPGARYLQGDDDLPRRTVVWLDQEEPGWRSASAGTPSCSYLRRDRDGWRLGFAPAPKPAAGETWTAIVGAYLQPVPMQSEMDIPFSYRPELLVSEGFSVPPDPVVLHRASLQIWVQAVIYLAASYLEKYRKDAQRQAMFLQLYDTECEKFTADRKPVGVRRVRVAHEYRALARRGRGRMSRDPRVW